MSFGQPDLAGFLVEAAADEVAFALWFSSQKPCGLSGLM